MLSESTGLDFILHWFAIINLHVHLNPKLQYGNREAKISKRTVQNMTSGKS